MLAVRAAAVVAAARAQLSVSVTVASPADVPSRFRFPYWPPVAVEPELLPGR